MSEPPTPPVRSLVGWRVWRVLPDGRGMITSGIRKIKILWESGGTSYYPRDAIPPKVHLQPPNGVHKKD